MLAALTAEMDRLPKLWNSKDGQQILIRGDDAGGVEEDVPVVLMKLRQVVRTQVAFQKAALEC